jgi:hypothetical protein
VTKVVGLLHCKFTNQEEQDPEKMLAKILSSPLALLAYIDKLKEEKQAVSVLLPSTEYDEKIAD